jgi:hypothetical protein
VSRNTSVLRRSAARSGAFSLALGVVPVKPHGYCVISSECASTFTLTVFVRLEGLRSLSPIRAPRLPSGATSVRSSRRPSIDGRS